MAKENGDIPGQTEEMPEEILADEPETTQQVVDPMAQLQADMITLEDRLLRQAAEYDNFRKRSQREMLELSDRTKIAVISAFLPVYDNLERALCQQTQDEAFFRGVEMTMQQLDAIFEKLNVEKIPGVGSVFNPEVHNAVMHIEDEAYGTGQIIEQFQMGFMLGEKVIRHAMVKVAN